MLSPEEELLRTQSSLREALHALTLVRDELKWKTAFMEAQANSSPDGIIVVNPQGKKILQNQRIVDLFKIPSEVAKNHDDASQVRWVTNMARRPEEFEKKVAHLYSHPDEVSHDEVELKDGTILDRYSSPVMGEDGTRYGRVWTFRNITGRKQDQEALRENEERFTGAFDHAPIGIALLSPEGRWMRVNHALSEMLGYSEAELLDCSFQEVTHPDDLDECLMSVRQLIEGEFKTCQSEKRYVHKDGHFVPVSFNLSLVRDENGKPRYLIAQIQNITEQKLAGQKLAANEELLRQFVRHTPAAIAMTDLNMRYIQVSDRWIKDYHLVGKDIIGKSHYTLFPDVPQRWKEIHQRVLGGAVESCAQDPFPRKDGSIEWLQWEARPWREVGGDIGGLIFFTQVITGRKREEEQVRFNEQRFRSLVEATTAIVWDTPASGEFEEEQAAWTAFTGQSFEELKGWGWLRAIHPDDQPKTARVWSSAVASRTPYEVEHRIRAADGSYRDMTVRAVPILGETGEIRQWIGVHVDITERKRGEEWLRILSSSVEQANESIVITDAQTDSPGPKIIFVNPAYTLMTGYSAEEAIGRTPRQLQGPRTDRTVLDRLRSNLAKGEVFKGQAINYRKDGSEFTIEWQVTPLRNAAGEVTHFLAIQRDITERIRQEEHLRLLGSAVSQSKEAIVITEAQLELPGPRIIFVNPAFTAMSGYSREEAIGKSPRILQGPKTDRNVLDRLRANLEKGEVFEGETINYRKGGEEFNLEWQITPLRNAQDEITHYVAIQRDVTERRRIENELHRQQTELRVLFDLMPVLIWFKDTNDRILRVNQAAAEITERTVEEIEGRMSSEIYPSYAAHFYDGDLEVIRAGVPRLGRVETVKNRRGEELWIQTDRVPFRDKDGTVIGVVVMVQDITLRKREEEELSQSREKLRLILDQIPQRVFWKDRNSVYLGCNQVLAMDLGFAHPDEVIGKTDFEINSKAMADLYRANDQMIIEQNMPIFNLEEPGRAADGSSLWLRTSKVPLHDQGGQVIGILGTYEDITEARLAKLEIQKLEAHLVQSQKLETVGKLAGGIAHEFNSILTAIIGQSDLLLADLPSSSPLIKSVTEIGKAARRAAVLTRQLLAYGRRQLLQPEILDLNHVLEGMKDMLRHLMGDKVEILFEHSGVRVIKADAGQIEQVVLNMAMNARDAMPNQGKLTLETDRISFVENLVGNYSELTPGDYVTLTITDTGIGMSPEVRARVFEPFFSTKAVGQGTGLGLSTCYGIIKQSGGYISVYSEPGRGSSFKIYLPEIKQEPRLPISQPVAPDLPRGSETILLVEDDPALREMAGALLRRLGYNVLEAAHGIEALAVKQRAGDVRIDLLFTDVIMPHMSGKELAERVRASVPETRILFTSAYTENAIAHQGMLEKGVALLQKPFTPSALAVKIREVLDS